MVIHAGHRAGLERFHDREIQLVRERHDAPATKQGPEVSRLELVARALKQFERGRSSS
jgi:hypothetical protein